jgi:hypothetical protein
MGRYRDVVAKYCKIRPEQVDSLPSTVKFVQMAEPAAADVERAKKWLK